jgi:stage IV sporulation protein FB
MRYTMGVGTYAGIPVRIHATFPLVLILYAAIAAASGSWRDGFEAMVLVLSVFVCVVLHEFGHCLQIKRYGIRVRDIVLFPIGGMARAESLPENPRHEIVVAISGPAVNFVIAGVLFAGLLLAGIPPHADGYLVSLAWVNLGLGLFNLIPAFPMDGGRILRGVLHLRMPYLAATRRARDIGQLLSLGFVAIAFMDTTFIMLAVVAIFVFIGGMLEERAVTVRMRLGGRRAGDLADTTSQVFAATDRIDAVFPRIGADAAPAYAIAAETGSLAGVVITSDLLRRFAPAARHSRFRQSRATISPSPSPARKRRGFIATCANRIRASPRWWTATVLSVCSTPTSTPTTSRARFPSPDEVFFPSWLRLIASRHYAVRELLRGFYCAFSGRLHCTMAPFSARRCAKNIRWSVGMSSAGTFQDTDVRQGTHESTALYNRAIELLNRNNVDTARKALEQALQICPQHRHIFPCTVCASRSTPETSSRRGGFARRRSR